MRGLWFETYQAPNGAVILHEHYIESNPKAEWIELGGRVLVAIGQERHGASAGQAQ